MSIELKDLQCFCLAAEMQHVTKAAEKLNISQPFLTKVINRIEKEIDVELFDNVGRKIVLNNNGKIFYARAKRILAEVDNLYAEMDEALDRSERAISLITNTTTYSSEMIVEFQKLYPDYKLIISTVRNDMIEKMLVSGDADFGLGTMLFSGEALSDIKTEIVFKESLYIMIHKKHPLWTKNEVFLKDLHKLKLVTFPKGFAIRNRIDVLLAENGVEPKIMVETGDINAIINSVRNGFGYAFIPKSMIMRNPEAMSDCLEIADARGCGEICLKYSSIFCLTKAKKDFRRFVRDYFSRIVERKGY